jgi:protein SCO1/2
MPIYPSCNNQLPWGGTRAWLGTAIVSCAIVGIAALALWSVTFGLRGWTTETIRRFRVSAHPPLLHSLRLTTSTGATLVPWGDLEFQPRIWLVTFMYTHCPTFCSSLGSDFERLQRRISTTTDAEGIGLLSISFDTSNDNTQALQRYASDHRAESNRWIVGVPLRQFDLDRIEHETGTVVINDGLGGFSHNGSIHVVLPDGRLVRIFNLNESEAALAWAQQYR